MIMSGVNDWEATGSAGELPQVAATATSDGLTTGTLANGNVFVNVTSASSNNIITLPAPIPGTRVNLYVGSNGYKLQSNAPATVGINGGTGSAVKSAIATLVYVELVCSTTTNWIGRQVTAAGVSTAVPVAS